LRHKTLGQTGLSVSILGFGASPLGDVFGVVTPEDGRAAVQHAIDSGINLFDVSPYYGLTLAEERLGAALQGRRHEVVLATKCGRYGADQFDFSATTVTREFEASLRRLQTDHVDLLQVHDIEFGPIEQVIEETLPALRRLQQQGKARFIGITGYWPELLAQVAKSTPVDTVLNYCHSNLLMDDMDAALAAPCSELGIGLMNASPLHMGLLGGAPVPDWHPAPDAVKAAAAEFVALCRAHHVEPATVALRACLDHDAVASTFMGFKSIAQVDKALDALTFETPAELTAAMQAVIAPVHNRTWPSGLPENQPEGMAHAG
jgi:L-galactose dehydrogenase